MALRRAAALLARLPSTSISTAQLAPAVFTRGMSGGLERFKEGQPVQTKRPAYDERDTPHTDKWLEVRPPPTAVHRIQRRIVINVADIVAWTSSRSPIARVDAAEPASPDKPSHA